MNFVVESVALFWYGSRCETFCIGARSEGGGWRVASQRFKGAPPLFVDPQRILITRVVLPSFFALH